MIYLLIYPLIGIVLVAVSIYQMPHLFLFNDWITYLGIILSVVLWPFVFGKQILFDLRYLWNKSLTFLHLK